jgi:hypothetical protein
MMCHYFIISFIPLAPPFYVAKMLLVFICCFAFPVFVRIFDNPFFVPCSILFFSLLLLNFSLCYTCHRKSLSFRDGFLGRYLLTVILSYRGTSPWGWFRARVNDLGCQCLTSVQFGCQMFTCGQIEC